MLKKLEPWLNLAERLISLIRPKFYNRLTWVVAVAGLIQMTTPWWTDIATAAAVRYLDLRPPSLEFHVGWGFGLVAVALTYHLIVHYMAELLIVERANVTKAAHKSHDIKIFDGFSAVMPEPAIFEMLSELNDEHAYRSSQGRIIDAGARYLSAPSTQFLESDLAASALEFRDALSDLRHWTSLNFFPHGQASQDYRYCLYPDLNEDRASRHTTREQSQLYNGFVRTLYEKTDAVGKQYLSFRDAVKKSLAI